MNKKFEVRDFISSEGKKISFPVATIRGSEKGPHAVITAGIHGAEYPPIMAAIEFYKNCNPEHVKGTITIVTISSVEAFEAKSIFVSPIDNKNPNRCFPGKSIGTYTEEMVYYLFREIISHGDYHIDMHGGDMIEALVPFAECCSGNSEEVDRKSREIADYYGVPNVIVMKTDPSDPPEGLCYLNSAKHGIPSSIVEAGQMGQTDRSFVEQHIRGLENVLKHFGNLDGVAEENRDIDRFCNWQEILSPAKGIFYSSVKPGEWVSIGQKIGRIEDYGGDLICEVTSDYNGKIMYMSSSPAIAEDEFILDLAIQ